MTAISTILSIGFLPINVLIYSNLTFPKDVLSTLNWASLGISLVVVVCAISGGLFISYLSGNDEKGKNIRGMLNIFGNFAGLGLILFTSLAPEGGRITLNGREPIFYYGTIMPIFFGLIASVIISTLINLKKPERVTVAVECVYQNTGIAMTSVLALFPDLEEQKRALAIPFWYTGMQTCFVGVYCISAWKAGWTKAPASDNIFKVLFTSYEEAEAEVVPEDEAEDDHGNDSELEAGKDTEVASDGKESVGDGKEKVPAEDDNELIRPEEVSAEDDNGLIRPFHNVGIL
jgi:hypothetical protein